jgi:hypothetical protein
VVRVLNLCWVTVIRYLLVCGSFWCFPGRVVRLSGAADCARECVIQLSTFGVTLVLSYCEARYCQCASGSLTREPSGRILSFVLYVSTALCVWVL